MSRLCTAGKHDSFHMDSHYLCCECRKEEQLQAAAVRRSLGEMLNLFDTGHDPDECFVNPVIVRARAAMKAGD